MTRISELGTTLAVTSNKITLLVTANFVRRSPIFVTLMVQALRSSETLVITRAIRRYIPENGILRSHRRENFKSYRYKTVYFCEINQFRELFEATRRRTLNKCRS
jgi:hypothetical protein